MRRLIVFTHIDKTAGTSFIDTLITPNYPDGIGGIMQGAGFKGNLFALLSRPALIIGHTPYGLHHFTRRPVDYVTFLRDPIDRAVSFYYFLKSPFFPPGHPHPFARHAHAVGLAEFYQDRHFQNWQTRLPRRHPRPPPVPPHHESRPRTSPPRPRPPPPSAPLRLHRPPGTLRRLPAAFPTNLRLAAPRPRRPPDENAGPPPPRRPRPRHPRRPRKRPPPRPPPLCRRPGPLSVPA